MGFEALWAPRWVDNATGNLQFLGREAILGRDCYKWSLDELRTFKIKGVRGPRSIAGVFPGHPNYYFQDVSALFAGICPRSHAFCEDLLSA